MTRPRWSRRASADAGGAAEVGPQLSLQASVGSKTRSAARSSHSSRNSRNSSSQSDDRSGGPANTRRSNRPAQPQGGEQVDVVIANGRRIVSDPVRASDQREGGPTRPPVSGPRTCRGAFSEEHNPRIADRECCEVIISATGAPSVPMRRPPSHLSLSTWWWRSSSTSWRRPRVACGPNPPPAAPAQLGVVLREKVGPPEAGERSTAPTRPRAHRWQERPPRTPPTVE